MFNVYMWRMWICHSLNTEITKETSLRIKQLLHTKNKCKYILCYVECVSYKLYFSVITQKVKQFACMSRIHCLPDHTT